MRIVQKNQIRMWVVLLIAVCFPMACGAAAVESAAGGAITRVTVYRGQALVTRLLAFDLPVGPAEQVITDLPAQIVPESLYAQAPDGVTILSVRYRERAVRDDTRDEVRQLDAQIEQVQRQLSHAQAQLARCDELWSMFVKLQEFTIKAAESDLNRGLLAFEPLEKLTSHIEQKGQSYRDQSLELHDTIEDFQKELDLLQRRRKELAAGRSQTVREAVVYLRVIEQRPIRLELSYLVGQADWSCQYNLRARPEQQTVQIEYNAVVHQASGEDWTNVALSLSTAQPTLAAAAPVLEPMPVSLASRGQLEQQVQQAANAQGGPLDATQQFQQLLQSRRDNVQKGKAAQSELNFLAAGNQAIIFNAQGPELDQILAQAAQVARTEGVSVTYALDGQLTLPSRSDQQLVTIATVAARAEFDLIATPLLTDYVYLQADLRNQSRTVFLAGPASMFRNGEFCGQGEVPLVTIGETFTAGFGIDSQIQVARQLEEKQTRIQGGNRIDTYRYRLTLANYKETAVRLRLLDRLAYTKNSGIRIELGETVPALSDNAEYLRTQRKKNLLRWDLELPASAVGEKAYEVTYQFTMEYDKNMQIRSQAE
ncbi:MAG: mucoidy inhibitor MuiA family protein [Sedimentisphaerales bacterium]|nr:mucoidy inhibitor MuiA family protein [Sedimentisphaerales bacterium]